MKKEDLRVVKTKHDINESFLKLFYSTDFDRITVKSITDQAGISRKTFYLHYLDKYDLLDTIVTKTFDELWEICEKKKGIGLIKGSEIWFDYFNNHRKFFGCLFIISNAGKYKHQLKKLIEKQLEGNVDRERIEDQGLNFNLFLSFFASGVIELIDVYISDESYTKKDMVTQIVPLLESVYK